MSEYKCPKCGGSDYFMSTRNVIKGVGGIWGNRGGLKEFAVCRVCDEIMSGAQSGKMGGRKTIKISNRTKVLFGIYFIGMLSAAVFGVDVFILAILANGSLVAGFVSLYYDKKNSPSH